MDSQASYNKFESINKIFAMHNLIFIFLYTYFSIIKHLPKIYKEDI